MMNRLTMSSCLTSLFAVAVLACSAEATPPRDGGSGGGGPSGGTPGGTTGGSTFGGSGPSGGTSFGGTPSTGGGFGFSGTPGTGGTPGTAGTPGTGGAATCPTTPVAAGKVDDLEDADNVILPPLQGYWYSYAQPGGMIVPPPDATGGNPWPPKEGGSTASPMRAACGTASGLTTWGAGIGFNLMDLGAGKVCPMNLTGTMGIKFNVKGTATGTGQLRVQVATSETALPASGGTCSAASAPNGCDYHANSPITVTAAWTPVTVLWTGLTPGGATTFSPANVLGIQFQAFDPMYTGMNTLPAFGFDFCIDDIEFL